MTQNIPIYKYLTGIFVSVLLLLVQPVIAQIPLNQFSLQAYKYQPDTVNPHSALRDGMFEHYFDLPYDTTRKRNWGSRKLFNEHLLRAVKPGEYSFYADFLPDFVVGRSSRNNTTWLNTRGVLIGGSLGKDFAFRAAFYENQGKLPEYRREFTEQWRVVPGQGEVKPYGNSGFDYAYSSALLSYSPGKYFNFQLGYDKNFIGNGYRSMLLSDNMFNFPFLKIIAGAGRVKYMVMWAQFIDMQEPKLSFHNSYRRKWGVFHYLDWNITDKLSVGLFESVIWQDADSTGKRGFDPSYLIPIAFARPVEFSVGSPDNALLGLNLKYDFSRNTTAYGQVIVDEFKLSEMISRDGWWANKVGGQIGIRSNNLFNVLRLNGLTEVNIARPYTFAQRSSMLSYTHYNQALAHPMGANFLEWVGIADFQHKRWYFRGELMFAKYGLDTAYTNFGKDIFKSYNTRNAEYGNKIGQGLHTNLAFVQATAAFLLNRKNNLRIELSVIGRQEKNQLFKTRELIYQIGLRSTFRRFYYDF